ncbi:TetR/AcrR family transcriptional regulator [Amycolatopsis jiangsuensis]|uniref:AcrR family transcriptional regulator n=1 Tax=Amycolatopsis jiangsuensis TaxID=1181879 RepID=A0A840J1P9_9PSEU|nr:TetR/AcrR family transcriptional regulator [Amycolatopsis jiangsuensis]MBB4687843.1 AcrR family transcriptional regulator [Amycolatopsis jiangsuensis]
MSEASPRERIVDAALQLLSEGGQDAVSTRAVSAAAGVQPPTIYRLFGDKDGLLDAIALQGFADYLKSKTEAPPSADPVDDLRRGWDQHVELGLANPALYLLMNTRAARSPAMLAAEEILADRVNRVAEAGRLRVPESLAASLIQAAGAGTTLSLINAPNPTLSTTAREAVLAAITTDPPTARTPGPASAATTLRAALPELNALTDNEKALMREWLDRITSQTR